ncbi:MAG TPA: helix-turn-helix domain-containing protein [Nitrobacter sp.]|nr:helix-turn-helix domain-containing protein [Nitrobacter sp.]
MTQDTQSQDTQTNAQAIPPDQIVPLLVGSTVGDVERELVVQTLARCDGNRTHAARVLGLSVRTLRNKIRQYAAGGLEVPASGHGGAMDSDGSEPAA